MNPSSLDMAARPQVAEREVGLMARLLSRRVPLAENDWALLTVEAPATRPELLVDALPELPHFYWRSRSGETYVGLGIAHEITAEGMDRMREVQRRAQEFFERCASPEARPRFFGGFAFAPDQATVSPWSGFGDARFMMPRWLYRLTQEGEATLSLLWDHAAELNRDALDYHGFAIESVLRQRPSDIAPQKNTQVLEVQDLDRSAWGQQVDAIRAAIGQGSYHKIVAARCSQVHTDTVSAERVLLERLTTAHPQCTHFAFAWEGSGLLLGATPELLVRREGDVVRSEALAGSIPIDEAEGLLESAKDALEHRLVVDAIVEALAPFVESLTDLETPRLRRLRDVAHLEVPMTGQLRGEPHVLELVRALHPTPAVGGMPQRGAQEWIVDHERQPRGWYSAPIGWFDASGDGDFAVALRCGVVMGKAVHVFAGAGIVDGSEPEAEYDETSLKMRALLGALGVGDE